MDDYTYDIYFDSMLGYLLSIDINLQKLLARGEDMDKKIKKLQKETKKLEKGEEELLKADKKRDKVCDYGEKMMKKKKDK